ncbi:alkene reductase [Sedimenticola thiotaurini]|uniref:N-ethylmaleimide reductase n=1 Tax=Sedimenticola thiotaurini TaxID=1543721 RepID=A0A0F7JU47_9GAMM|nr:alkene reductase [Sedimenticola thiotaurini]AKH19147.1 N-ethylmaleimide reductase [Sedimenticola thiotaurini]
MTQQAPLFASYRLGNLQLTNRIVMAPLTRSRAGAGCVPTQLMAEYYAQRASAGLIIAEAAQISQQGQGYQNTPGIYNQEQIDGWRLVTEAVHAAGGHIFLQLWHVGRVSHTSLQPGGAQPVAPSAIRADALTFVDGAFIPASQPRALRIDEIAAIVEEYRQASANALAAGFDGVEIHAANGYLIDQFLRDGSNQRTDRYGGSIENRSRFLMEVMGAVIAEAGAQRVGVRLSPVSPANGVSNRDNLALFETVFDQLNQLAPVYLHVIEGATMSSRDHDPDFDFTRLRQRFSGTYIANNGYNLELAKALTESDPQALVAFGRPFIANPDLVQRLKINAPLQRLDKQTLYGGGAAGYTDYPLLEAESADTPG